MSILIRGMEMPKDGELLCIDIHPDGKVCINLDLSCEKVGTAIPVPPHGDLIERDALGIRGAEKDAYDALIVEKNQFFQEETTLEYLRGYSDGLTHASGLVRFAPTIIPAEEDTQ